MKAVLVENDDHIENITIREVAKPELSAGMVRVRTQAAAVGFVDGLEVQGLYQTKDRLPFTPGSGFAGVVDIAAIAAFFGLSNRLANVTSMRPNPEFSAMGRG